MVSSTAYYIKFDGFSPTFFNQFPVVSVTKECRLSRRISIRRLRSTNVSAKMARVYYGLKADWWFLKIRISRKKILDEAHLSKFSMHPGSTKMYHDPKPLYWWTRMKREIAQYVSECDTC
jgi:hypothetical protein